MVDFADGLTWSGMVETLPRHPRTTELRDETEAGIS